MRILSCLGVRDQTRVPQDPHVVQLSLHPRFHGALPIRQNDSFFGSTCCWQAKGEPQGSRAQGCTQDVAHAVSVHRPGSINLGPFSCPCSLECVDERILPSTCHNNGAYLARLRCLRYPTYVETKEGGCPLK